jgi:DNA-binding LacI/PurR family transcriptional regulator
MENDILYLSLKNKICEGIFSGSYKDGENIPPERVLAENFNVSRVTVRKSLELLEKDGIVERVQGSGTMVKLRKTGYAGTMELIALLAPAQKPFFSTFIDHFQKNAEKNDSLVLLKQNTQDERVEDSLFKLLQKNIRNVVIWLEDLKLDREAVHRLRGLGMNMVFFDIILPTPYADCVLLDNRHAITTLYDFLKGKGVSDIGYVGWDNFDLSSVSEREHGFMEISQRKMNPVHFQWTGKNNLSDLAGKYADELKRTPHFPDGIICGDGEIGIALKKSFLENGIQNIAVVSVDDFPEAGSLSMSVYMQSFDDLAQQVYQCLLEQNMNPGQWKASVRPVKGKLIER